MLSIRESSANVTRASAGPILLVETASPKRVRHKAEEILKQGAVAPAELTILCRDDAPTVRYLGQIAGAQIIPLEKGRRREILRELRRQKFAVAHLFWTAEKEYRRMKRTALRLGAGVYQVDIGDGHGFRLGWGVFARFVYLRWKYPQPADRDLFVFQPEAAPPETHVPAAAPIPARPGPDLCCGEKVLVVQSAEPHYLLRALDRLKEQPVFKDPGYTLFCRNLPEVTRHFWGHPMLREILVHSETRSCWKHLRALRRARFDAVVVFFTGDPSYWKIKFFVFLLGARHKLIFNENNDCFFFSWRAWLSLLAHRLGERTRLGARPRWSHQVLGIIFLLVKVMVLPFRFVWLMITALRLRWSARKA